MSRSSERITDSSVGLYARVLGYLKPYGRLVTAAVIASAGFAALDAFSLLMLIPFLKALFGQAPLQVEASGGAIDWLLGHTIGLFIDAGAPPDELLLGIILFILGIFVVKNIFDFFKHYLTVRLEQEVTRDLRDQVYSHLLELDLRFFGGTKTGQIISRLTTDANQLRSLATKELSKIVTAVLQIVAAVAILVAISLELTFIALVVLPAMFGIWGGILKRLRHGNRRVLDLAGEVASHIQETVSGIRLVKASAAERFERGRFTRLTRSYYRNYVHTEQWRAMVSPLTETMGAIGTVLLLWYGSRLVLVEGTLDAGMFIGFLALSMNLYSPAKKLAKVPARVQKGLVAAERVFEFLDSAIEIHDRPGARAFPGVRESIDYRGVSFSYVPGEAVLDDISFEVGRGDVVALVGPSGAGKTTFVDLLARFYDPTEGRITVDGTDLREFGIDSLRSRLGIVTQETVLFHDSVRANIAYGLGAEVSDEALERAARVAHAHEFVVRLPDGYDTLLGERGVRLSGGQRQRIAIARAILRDPPILIFDEATSSLDSESERLVQDAITQLLEGRTVFVIAHRLSTIRRADQILVLRDGRIVEHGRHQELLDRDGTYRRFHDLQLANA